jgi:hypothetical protein
VLPERGPAFVVAEKKDVALSYPLFGEALKTPGDKRRCNTLPSAGRYDRKMVQISAATVMPAGRQGYSAHTWISPKK